MRSFIYSRRHQNEGRNDVASTPKVGSDRAPGDPSRYGTALPEFMDPNREDRRAERSGLSTVAGDMKRHEFVLRYTLSHPGCHTSIVGTGDLDHLCSNLRAVEACPLPQDLYETAKAQLAESGEQPEDN